MNPGKRHLFVTDAEVAAINDACFLAGAGATVALEVVCALDEARTAEELHKMLLAGRAVPVILDGKLRWTLSQAARDELAGRISTAILTGEVLA